MGIMNKANVFDLEIKLLPLPLGCPREVCFLELLSQFGNFNGIRRRKENLEAYGIAGHRPISSTSPTIKNLSPDYLKDGGDHYDWLCHCPGRPA